MDQEFITIGEAARLLKQADSTVMRLIKEALQEGIEKEEIMRSEMRDGRMMYLVSKTFLVAQAEKEKEVSDNTQTPLPRQEFSTPAQKESTEGKMIEILQKIIDTKDQQIGDLGRKIDELIERDHETNILLKGLQDRLFLLEQGSSQDRAESEKKRRKERGA